MFYIPKMLDFYIYILCYNIRVMNITKKIIVFLVFHTVVYLTLFFLVEISYLRVFNHSIHLPQWGISYLISGFLRLTFVCLLAHSIYSCFGPRLRFRGIPNYLLTRVGVVGFISHTLCVITVFCGILFFTQEAVKSTVDQIPLTLPEDTTSLPGWKLVSRNIKGYEIYQPIDNTSPTEVVSLKGWNTSIKSGEDCLIELKLYEGKTLTIKYICSENCMYLMEDDRTFSTKEWTSWQENLDNSETIRFLPLDKPLEVALGRSLDGSLPALR